MLRKFALVIVAVSSLGVATLTPTPASAWRGGWHGGGADHVSSCRRDFTEADVSSGVLSLARGDHVGFS